MIGRTRGSGENLFVTGRAGTGKSTLLRCLKSNLPQKTAVLAPTGLAAVNVQGQTIHSFFGFPPQIITAEIVKKCRKAALFRNLDTIVIDEVSMVRADLMQGIDMALRMTRKQPAKPFGGVQIVAMGDLHQLPPVVREREMIEHFRETFGGVYFFNAPVFQDAPLGLVELNHGLPPAGRARFHRRPQWYPRGPARAQPSRCLQRPRRAVPLAARLRRLYRADADQSGRGATPTASSSTG